MECLREAIGATKGRYEVGVALETSLRHDHGSPFVSHAFQDELTTVGIESSASFVRQPEGNGRVGRFIRTLTEQLLWLLPFATVVELDKDLRDFTGSSTSTGSSGGSATERPQRTDASSSERLRE